jgi:iron(III) transport system substrate-binding protein
MRPTGILVLGCVLLAACRIERVSPHEDAAEASLQAEPHGELWVYTSAFPAAVDELDALAKKQLPKVSVRWFKAGSEKVASRIEGELAAGGTKADLLLVSDPFLYERYKEEGLLRPYVSPAVLRLPRSLLDPDGYFTTVRVSTMVLAFKDSLQEPPRSFLELAEPKWRGQVAIGDPLSSGTVFTWVAFEEAEHGREFFPRLRANNVAVAGGNAAVQARIESGEAKVGVLLLESVLAAKAKGSALSFRFPEDGSVTIPGYAAIFKSSRNVVAAQAFYDLLLSPEGQSIVVRTGRMHSPDPRQPGPDDLPNIDKLMEISRPWSEQFLRDITKNGAEVKARFAEAFAK